MKRKQNYPRLLLQWGVFVAIVLTVGWAAVSEQTVDVEKYCPFGGLQAFGTFLINNSLACSMSMVQIAMGLVLAVGVIFFSKLFCGYLCPLGTLGEAMGRVGQKLRLQINIVPGGIADRLLRGVKYALLFTILYNTFLTSELFCKKLDPYYAMATGFQGEIVVWMTVVTLCLLFVGGFFVKMFWCKYICPLGAASNIFKYFFLLIIAGLVAWILGLLGLENVWVWILAAVCVSAALLEIFTLRSWGAPTMTIVRDDDACNGCGLCQKRCPYSIAVPDLTKVRHIDCTLCGECVSSCHADALQVSGKRSMRYVPFVMTVVLFVIAVVLGQTVELPTIDLKWGNYEQLESENRVKSYSLDGLQSIKCYGSSSALAMKMEKMQGVVGLKTFVRRHGVEIFYDERLTDTVKLKRALFTPMTRKYKNPTAEMTELKVVKLGVEGLHDRMDLVYFGMALQRVKSIYGFTAEFSCPVDVTLYCAPDAVPDEDTLREVIEAEELVFPTKTETKVFPMHNELRSYREEGVVSSQEFSEVMFREIKALSGRYSKHIAACSDEEKYPRAIYELEYKAIEHVPVRGGFPYFKSFLSGKEGILSVDLELKGTMPVIRLTYVTTMWNDARIWKEIFNAPSWTIHMVDGTTKEMPPKMKFVKEGHTLSE